MRRELKGFYSGASTKRYYFITKISLHSSFHAVIRFFFCLFFHQIIRFFFAFFPDNLIYGFWVMVNENLLWKSGIFSLKWSIFDMFFRWMDVENHCKLCSNKNSKWNNKCLLRQLHLIYSRLNNHGKYELLIKFKEISHMPRFPLQL